MGERISDAEAICASATTPDRFALIFDRHFEAIQSYLRRRITRPDADDLAAETFVIAFRRREDYDPTRPNARPWLFGIAVNLLRRHRRRERRELRAYARTAVDPLQPEAPAVESRVDAAAMAPQLAGALASLSPGDREVLFLYACADLSYDEIAEALGIPTGTVRSRLHRARQRVRELIGARGQEQGEGMIQPRSAR